MTANSLTFKMKKPQSPLISLLSPVLNFLYPPYCHICGNPLSDGCDLVCNHCWDSFVPYGNFTIRLPEVHRELESVVVGLFAETDLDDPLNNIIHELKYDRRIIHAKGLASRLSLLLASYNWMKKVDMIVPVPLHPSRIRSRGYNQSQLIADHIGNIFGIPVVSKVIDRIRPTQSQTRLNQEQRIRNVRGAFEIRDSAILANRSILLIDDVVTTGATLNECAIMLKKGGAKQVNAAAAVHFQQVLP